MSREASYRRFSGSAAENYQQYFVPTIASAVAPDLLGSAALRAGERVLDLACGTGIIARRAAVEVGGEGEVVGLDVSPDMIRVAGTVPTEPEAAGIEWRVGDAMSLPLPADSFEVVLCQMGLMFVEDKAAALSEIRRVLAPGGRLALNTPGQIQPPFEIMDEGIATAIDSGLAGFVRMVFSMDDPEAVGRLLVDAGLADVTTANPTTLLRLPPPAEFLWQYINLTPLGAPVGNAPAEARDALEEQVVEGWQPYVEQGETVVRQPMVVATGRKQSADPGAA